MSCYLKISAHNRHKKYRYCRDRPINFHQIRKEMAPSAAPQNLTYLLMLSHAPLQARPSDIPFTKEQDLAAFLKNYEFQPNETLKIRLIDQRDPLSQQQAEDEDSLTVPTALTKIRSKSDDIEHTAIVLMGREETTEVTQEFLCSSGVDFSLVERNTELEWVEKEMAANQRRNRQLQERRQFTNFAKIHTFLKRQEEREENE